MLDDGARLTEAHLSIAAALGVRARVLPMSDRPVRTRVMADGAWWSLQEFLIRRRGEGPVQDVDFRHAAAAAPSPEVLDAIHRARAIVIGPSNPVISIGPILALPGLTDALAAAAAPVVAVSPLVKGAVLKGPTESFLRWAGHAVSSAGIAETYHGLIDGLVADERTHALTVLETERAHGRRRRAPPGGRAHAAIRAGATEMRIREPMPAGSARVPDSV